MLRVIIKMYEELAIRKVVMIFRHLYRFLPEESDRLNFHAGVNQVTLSVTHDNGYIVDWRISIFHIADALPYIRVHDERHLIRRHCVSLALPLLNPGSVPGLGNALACPGLVTPLPYGGH